MLQDIVASSLSSGTEANAVKESATPTGQQHGPPDHHRGLREHHKMEKMFGRRNDWRRIHARYARCADTFMSAICIAATVILRLNR
jgi:transposase